jgi:putative nucleotidyltransferase with HDIG domain
MTRATYVFIGVVAAAALGLLQVLSWEPLLLLPRSHAIGLFAFFSVAVVAEGLAIDFGTGKQARSSLAFLPFLGCTALFYPSIAVLIGAGVVAVSNFVLRRQGIAKGVFNIAQVTLSIGLAGLFYQFAAEPLLSVEVLTGRADFAEQRVSIFAFVGLAAVFFITNILLTSFALAVIRRTPLPEVVVQVIGPRGSNLWYDLLAIPIAMVGVILYQDLGITGLLIILLPLLLVRYSYLSKLQLEEANRDLLKVLVKAIETRDPYTSGHSLRVATLSRLIAKDLDLPARQVEQIETAALLHDIGKIDSVYSAVIRKPYDLNAEERSLIRTHATKGADLLQSLSSVSSDVIRAVRHHHERVDGTGYPAGLVGEEIPIAARIIMLSDSIDAMLSDRPYRKALGIEQVYSELARCASTQFDPHIVRVILSRDTLQEAAALVKRSVEFGPETPALISTA